LPILESLNRIQLPQTTGFTPSFPLGGVVDSEPDCLSTPYTTFRKEQRGDERPSPRVDKTALLDCMVLSYWFFLD